MADLIHKYYCTRCERFVYGENLGILANAVNYHATAFHITSSTQDSGTPGPLPQYLAPHGTTSKRVPQITDEDRAMLMENLIKWD